MRARTSRCSGSWFPVKAIGAAIACALGAPSGAEESDPSLVPPSWREYVQREVLDRLRVAGFRRLGYRLQWIEGDREAYGSLNDFGQGSRPWLDVGLVTLEGRRVLGLVDFQTQIVDNRFADPQSRRFTLRAERGPWTFQAGDIQGVVFDTNEFARLTRSLRGVAATYRRGPLAVRALRSEARGSARTVTIPGNNTPGPYFLQSSQIIVDSETVRVDGEELRRGVDYVVNAESGTLTFRNRVVPPTSTIVVTYEALGFSTSPGLVEGLGLTYDFGTAGRLGLTAARQRSRSGGRLGQRLEKFFGFGPPSAPYFLQFEPLPGAPIEIRVDGVVQVEGVDYRFDPQTPTLFFFTRFIPFTSQVDVLYTPRPRGTVDGDRENWGLDYRIGLGPGGRLGALELSYALGRLGGPTPSRGEAKGARLRYASGPWNLDARVRDVPAGYVSVETRGFGRNERASDLRLEYRPAPAWTYRLQYGNSAIAARTVGDDGRPRFLPQRLSALRTSVENVDPRRPDWSLSYQRTESRDAGRRSTVDSADLEAQHAFGSLRLRVGLGSQRARGFVRTAQGLEPAAVDLALARLAADYRPNDRLSLTARATLAQVDSSGSNGLGRDVNLALSYAPRDDLQIAFEVTSSDGGPGAALAGFQSGFGFGYDGNGFSGGSPLPTPAGTASTLEATRLSATYTPSERLSVVAGFTRQRTTGSLRADAESSGATVNASWRSGPQEVLLGLARTETRFLGSPLTSDVTSVELLHRAQWNERWSSSAGLRLLLSGGTSEFRQNASQWEAGVGYRLGSRETLSFDLTSATLTGYRPQTDVGFSLNYRYQLWKNLAFVASYRFRDVVNRDPDIESGAYRASGLAFELAFDFGP